MILRRRCRSNIRIGFAVKNTMIKPTCRRTEDIIGSSLYITPIVILPAILIPCKQCILISQQPTNYEQPHSLLLHAMLRPARLVPPDSLP